MKFLLTAIFLFTSAVVVLAQNAVINLLAPLESVAPGGTVRVDLVVLNPTAAELVFETPQRLEGRLSSEHQSWPVALRGLQGGGPQIPGGGFSNRPFEFVIPVEATGRLVLELDSPQAARAVIEVANAVELAPAQESVAQASVAETPLSSVQSSQPAQSALQRTFAGRFAAHEPVYFIYGLDAPRAKFQFSFKYRLLGDNGRLGDKVPALRGVFIGFTQRSLWDIEAESSPFYDTSYMPELMFESQSYVDAGKSGGFQLLGFQAGVRHESNGRDGLASRSLNILYIRPGVAFGPLDGWNLVITPRFFTYIVDVENNPDIADYRGYSEVSMVFGKVDRFSLAVTGRLGKGGHKGSFQADLTIPVRFDKLFDFATYVLIQYWDGYGESLRSYNQRNSSIRAGFSLVR